jgi:small subunit ribosomal protein S14
MTASDWKKVLKQIRHKPAKAGRFIKHSKPIERTTGIAKRKCERCGRFGGHLKQYNLNLCRHCFREIAEEIGFKKYN